MADACAIQAAIRAEPIRCREGKIAFASRGIHGRCRADPEPRCRGAGRRGREDVRNAGRTRELQGAYETFGCEPPPESAAVPGGDGRSDSRVQDESDVARALEAAAYARGAERIEHRIRRRRRSFSPPGKRRQLLLCERFERSLSIALVQIVRIEEAVGA